MHQYEKGLNRRFYCRSQAVAVLTAASPASEPSATDMQEDKVTPKKAAGKASPEKQDIGVKRGHSRGGPQQFPYNGKKARTSGGSEGRPFFAEIVDDSGKRTRVPCSYDASKKMYVPTGGRDVVPGGKVGTRDKTIEDLQALPLGEMDEQKLRARQKQIDIGKNTEGYRRLMEQGVSGRELQHIIALPYITEDGVLELTLKCSKKRYDGYLRMSSPQNPHSSPRTPINAFQTKI